MNRLQFLFLSICAVLVPFAVSREQMIEAWFKRNGFVIIRDTHIMRDGVKRYRTMVYLLDTYHGVMCSELEDYPLLEWPFRWIKDKGFRLETTPFGKHIRFDDKLGLSMYDRETEKTFITFTPPIWA